MLRAAKNFIAAHRAAEFEKRPFLDAFLRREDVLTGFTTDTIDSMLAISFR